MIAFNCHECGQSFQVKDEYAGRQTKCRKCGTALLVPALTVAAAPQAKPAGATPSKKSNRPLIIGAIVGGVLFIGLLCCGGSILVITLVAGSGHGKELKFNGGQIFYTSAVTKEQAEKLGNYLVKEKFFDGNPKTIQLNKSGSIFEFRMVVKKGIEHDQTIMEVLRLFGSQLSKDVFDSAPVDIHVCDENLKTIRVVVPLR